MRDRTEGPLTYEAIEPLVRSAEVHTSSLYVTFRCPETGVEVVGTARLGERTPIGGHLHRRGDADRIRYAREQHARAFLRDGGPPAAHGPPYSFVGREIDEPTRHHAVVQAFEGVRNFFRWDASRERWVGRDAEDAARPDA